MIRQKRGRPLGMFLAVLFAAVWITGCYGDSGAAGEAAGNVWQYASEAYEAGQSEGYAAASYDAEELPEYDGRPYVELNGNQPMFKEEDLQEYSYEDYAPLDRLGRCQAAAANIGPDLMPQEERESIGQIRPSGWHTVKYDVVDGNYLYNRCHLIGYQLTGENANERNLITGTRYMNTTGMMPFENRTADYIEETGNHVLYRVTPVFDGDNLLADGVVMEAESVEDGGAGLRFCVYVYNVQPGVAIDYRNGDSWLDADTALPEQEARIRAAYIVNINTDKFHYPDCSSVEDIREYNKLYFWGSRKELLLQGFSPCGRCRP